MCVCVREIVITVYFELGGKEILLSANFDGKALSARRYLIPSETTPNRNEQGVLEGSSGVVAAGKT